MYQSGVALSAAKAAIAAAYMKIIGKAPNHQPANRHRPGLRGAFRGGRGQPPAGDSWHSACWRGAHSLQPSIARWRASGHRRCCRRGATAARKAWPLMRRRNMRSYRARNHHRRISKSLGGSIMQRRVSVAEHVRNGGAGRLFARLPDEMAKRRSRRPSHHHQACVINEYREKCRYSFPCLMWLLLLEMI